MRHLTADELNNYKELNTTFSDYPRMKALGNLLLVEPAKKTPDRIAVKCGDVSYTYEILNKRVNQLTRLLIASGINVGDKVGLCLDRSAEMVICFLAILKAGAAYVPLDTEFPVERVKYMLEDSHAKVVVTSRNIDCFADSQVQLIYFEDAFKYLDKYDGSDIDVGVCGNDLAYILYTSGSTGKPKGVQIVHHNLVNFLLSMQKAPGFDENDILLSLTTISFDIFGLELYLPLLCGGTLLIADKNVSRDGRLILDIVRNEKVSVLQATPYTWKMLLESGWEERLPIKVFCGGEALSKNLASQLIPKCNELWNMYGPTETTIYSTIKKIENSNKPITIGKPIDNTAVYILNDQMELQLPGEIGEICIGGEGVSRGYTNRPELTAEKFIEDKFGAGAEGTIYRTGDLGKLTADGEIVCLGRLDHQIKIRGFRIEVEEIEENLVKLDNITDAVVVVHTDANGNQRLVAYVINETKIESDELLITYIDNWERKLADHLPDYMLPNAFVPVLEFPKTLNGKVDKKALPPPVFKSDLTEYKAPKTGTEKKLVEIWQKCLDLRKLGIDDDFFELGGHSIIAVRIMIQIEKQMNYLLPISSFFKHPTVRKLAELIDADESSEGWKSLVCIKEGAGKSPLYIVHGIGLNVLIFHDLAKNLDPAQPVYGLQAVGLNAKDEPLEDFKEIAAFYIREILEHNPEGPYNILGYSLGGIIALEMAKQLQSFGKLVSMLGMLDTNLKSSDGDTRSVIFFNKLKRQIPKAAFVFQSMLKNPARTLDYQLTATKVKLHNMLNAKSTYRTELPNEDIPGYMEKIIAKLEIGWEKYKVERYNGKIYLFKAKERVYYVDDPEYLGWREIADDGIVVKEVPGDHKIVLLLPNVIEFAKILQKVLNEL